MCAFSVIDRVPGVYIDEVLVAGAIAGVGTSTLALIGPAEKGPINVPTLVTNPTQFADHFGGHLVAPRFYASYALQGFFANGGTSCYFVRASNGSRASRALLDQAGRTTIVVSAKAEGAAGNAAKVAVQDAGIATTNAARGTANLAGAGAQNATATVADASQLRVGDVVLIEGGGNNERATLKGIAGTTLTFEANLTHVYAAGTVRVADLALGQKTFRIADPAGIEPGSYVNITQGAVSEKAAVNIVKGSFITLAKGLTNAFTMAIADPAVSVATLEFTLVLTAPGQTDETFSNLSVDPRHSRFFGTVLADAGSLIADVTPPEPPDITAPPDNRPVVLAASALAGGLDDNPVALGAAHYQTAIDSLEKVDAVTLLAIPDRTDQAVQGAMITHCEKMQDRFAILDPRRGADPNDPATGIRNQRSLLTSDRGYGALYYPWIKIADPTPGAPDGQLLLVPPSGHVAGVFARTDAQQGVHKAPANEAISGVLDLERTLNDTEAGQLNELSINVLRRIPNRGHRIWGARTLSTRTQWRYVNVRRLLLFIEESIQEGTEEAVFQPNNPALWKAVKRQVDDFLTRVWSDGALFGNKPEDAFRVRVDDELNPPSEIALGKLTLEVKVRPTTPAEFIIFRVIADPSRAIVEE